MNADNAKLPWKIFVGFFVGLLALITLFICLLLWFVDGVHSRLFNISLGIAIAGFTLLVWGHFKSTRRRKNARSETAKDDCDWTHHPLAFLGRLEFWGSILLLCAPPIYFLSRLSRKPVEVAVAPPIVAVAPAPVRLPEPVVEFPPLQLQGFVSNGSKSTAVIDGQTLQVGDSYNNVRLVAIVSEGVMVEFQGKQKVLTME